MATKLWKLTEIHLTLEAEKLGIENVQYAYHIHGEYLAPSGKEGDFSWTIPAVEIQNPQFDLSQVQIPK